MDGNKDESEKCISFAERCIRTGDIKQALKYLQKAEQLYETDRAKVLLSVLAFCNSEECVNESESEAGASAGITPPHESASSGRGAEHESQHKYTPDQLDAVRRIQGCEDHYEMLGVGRSCDGEDIKRSYKKLALKFHPDKNRAPGADDAFKAIGNAFGVLSDPTRRRVYDDTSRRSQHSWCSSHCTQSQHSSYADQCTHYSDYCRQRYSYHTSSHAFHSRSYSRNQSPPSYHQGRPTYHQGRPTRSQSPPTDSSQPTSGYQTFFDDDVTAEEMIRKLFEDAFRTAHAPRQTGPKPAPSTATYTTYSRPKPTRQSSMATPPRYEESHSFLVQISPIIFLVLLTIISTMFIGDSAFSLHQDSKYVNERQTQRLDISYYVKDDFLVRYGDSLYRLEQQVEEEFIGGLQYNCYREKNYRETLLWRARLYHNEALFQQAKTMKTPSCDSLQSLISMNPVTP